MGYQTSPIATEMKIAKMDAAKKQVFGWANVANTWRFVEDHWELVPVIDTQQGIMEITALEDAAYAYVAESRKNGEMHWDYYTGAPFEQVGYCVESMVFTKEKQAALGIPDGLVPEGWWLGIQLTDDDAWDKVVSGVYGGFSIQGSIKYVDEQISGTELEKYDLPNKEEQ